MQKKDIKSTEVLNFNKISLFNLTNLKDGKNIYVVKKGRNNLYFLEIEKTNNSVFIERYNFKNAIFSKYENNLIFNHFENLKTINFKFIDNFDKICISKNTLQQFNLI